MADLNKFQRSKDRIIEILNYLMLTEIGDDKSNPFISTLEKSLQVLDNKIDELKRNSPGSNKHNDQNSSRYDILIN